MTDYETFLKIAARKWGATDYHEAAKCTPELESVSSPDGHVTVGIFYYNKKWGYCLSMNFYRRGGFSYGPFLKFSEPYESRHDAIQSAMSKVVRECEKLKRKQLDEPSDKNVIHWAKTYIDPQQLSLF